MNRNLDILKYIMSIMIIMIHSCVFFNAPLLRVAVPIFFIISSYLFFTKINDLSESESKIILVKFIKRAWKLYLYWFIVLFPYMIISHIMEGNLKDFVIRLPLNIIFRSSFPVSWYIAAYIIDIYLLYTFKKYNKLFFVVSIICYIVCCMETNYFNILRHYTIHDYISPDNNIAIDYLMNFYHSFPAGLIYVWFGKQIVNFDISNLKSNKYILWGGGRLSSIIYRE